MGLRLSRFLGPAPALEAGQWTDQTSSGHPAVACPGCGFVSELAEPHRVFGAGIVSHVWSCPEPDCPFLDFLSLDAWNEDVIR